MLQWEFSLRLMPERVPLRDVFDALSLATQVSRRAKKMNARIY
jgi:hypothetical protein